MIYNNKQQDNNNLQSLEVNNKIYGFLWKQKISKKFNAPIFRGKIKIAGIEYSIVVYDSYKKTSKSPDYKMVLTKIDNSNKNNKMTQLHLGGNM